MIKYSIFEKRFEVFDFHASLKHAQKRIEGDDVIISVMFKTYINIMNDSSCQLYQFA